MTRRNENTDHSGMIEDDLELLNSDPTCVELLKIYQEQDQEKPESGPRGSARMMPAVEVEDSEAEAHSAALSSAHGLLIAFGLLDTELVGRDEGMRYRVTPDGVRALKTLQQLQESRPAC